MYQKDGLRDPTETLAMRYCPYLSPAKGMRREYLGSILSTNAPVSAGVTSTSTHQFAIQDWQLKAGCDRFVLADSCRKHLPKPHRQPHCPVSGFGVEKQNGIGLPGSGLVGARYKQAAAGLCGTFHVPRYKPKG